MIVHGVVISRLIFDKRLAYAQYQFKSSTSILNATTLCKMDINSSKSKPHHMSDPQNRHFAKHQPPIAPLVKNTESLARYLRSPSRYQGPTLTEKLLP